MNHPTSGTLALCPVCSMPDGRHVLGCPAHDATTCKGCQEFGWAPHDATLLDLGYQDHCSICGARMGSGALRLCPACRRDAYQSSAYYSGPQLEREPPRVALAAAVALVVALVAFAVLVYLA